jgi:hypothetical protein
VAQKSRMRSVMALSPKGSNGPRDPG